jgi:hypothetical protein
MAPSLGVQASPVDIRDPAEIERACAAFAGSRDAGLVVPASGVATVHSGFIVKLAARYKLPAVYAYRSIVIIANNATGFVLIKWVQGRSNPFIQLAKTNWQFPADLQVPFSVDLDNGGRQFVGVSKSLATKSIIVTHDMDEGSGWLSDFASSKNDDHQIP